MKIKQVACEQFAGVTNRRVEFQDGLNLIYGKNESGKSTLIHLIARTLFQKENLDRRSDKAFIANYFPSESKTRRQEERADGTITLTTAEGDYTLEKQWSGKGGACLLTLPNGDRRRDDAIIQETLQGILQYGEGVYNELLLSSQKNTGSALANLLSAKDEAGTRKELVDTVSAAFSESDGISTDALERALEEKLAELGSQWDEQRDMPGRGHRTGEVKKAYDHWVEVRSKVDTMNKLEAAIEPASRAYEAAQALQAKAAQAYEDFDKYAGILMQQRALKDAMARNQKDLDDARAAKEQWPQLQARLEALKALAQEQKDRQTLDQFDAVKKQQETVTALQKALAARKCPTAAEVQQARQLHRVIDELESDLRGINLVATLKRLGTQQVQITSLRTGRTVELSDGAKAIREAVKITVPGVLELQLAPASLDVPQTQADLTEKRAQLQALLAAYQAEDVDALVNLQQETANQQRQLQAEERELTRQLQGVAFAELEARAQAVTAQVRSAQEIAADMRQQCGSLSVDYAIGKVNSELTAYGNAYGTRNDLALRVGELEKNGEALAEKLAQVEEVPEQYARVTDAEQYKRELKRDMEQAAEACSQAKDQKIRAETTLENAQNADDAVSREDLEAAQQALDEQKALLHHWLHIREVFRQQRESLHANPMQELAERFVQNLDVISAGHVDAELPNKENLDMQVYSDGRLMDFGKLSEGTKDTVSLAFRLAVLDHLFPEGGGVMVLDDPFTDMDEERVKQSCALVKACAERHQVIFLTCREEYIPLLGGHCIRMDG